jgi:2-oxoglutarate dehydrogenase complex dihydrolipoamide succinyltransferase (E2) component
MPISIVVPQLGESVAEGTVSRWLKAEGDKVRKEEPLVEIQTDKINVEIPSPADGVLSRIVVKEGTTVLVGTEIATLAGADEGALVGAPAAAAPAPPAPAPAKAAAPAPAAPPAARPTPAGPAPARAPMAAAPSAPPAYGSFGNGEALEGQNLSPSVRKLMRENQVSVGEIGTIRGSGVGGRVTREDLITYLERRVAPTAAVATPAPAAAAPPPSFLQAAISAGAGGPRTEVVPFTKVRKVIAEHMVHAKHTAAHTHCFDECDMSAIVALKKEWGPRLETQGVKLTYMPFFIKAAVFALREFPWVNGEVKDDTIIVKHYYNIGMAVGRDEKGLIVPNVKDCDRKNLVQLAREVNDLAGRARADRLKPDDIADGTFSITNAGVFGAINSAPIIAVPEVAILGVHKIVERPVVKDGQIVVRPMMNTAIGFDHRVIDGEMAVKFLRRFCELIEKPELLWFFA